MDHLSVLRRVSRFTSDRLLIWVVLASALGILRPATFIPILDYVELLLGLIMLGMGLTLRPEDFRRLLERPFDISIGAGAQWLIMPFAAYGLYQLLNLPDAVGMGLILVGAAPGGTASNVMTYLGRGDVALSVAITALTTLAAPIIMPAWTLLFLGESIEVTFTEMLISIAQIVMVPVAIGFILRYLLDKYAPEMVQVGVEVFSAGSVILISIIIAGVVGSNVDNLINAGAAVVTAVIAHNAIGLATGYSIARTMKMPIDRVRTCTFEVGLQNSGLAVALATSLFTPEAALIPALFSVWHNLSGSALANYFAWRETIHA